MKDRLNWVAVLLIGAGLMFGTKAISDWMDRREREAKAEQRRADESAQRQAALDAFNAQRGKLLADAKRAFVNSDPKQAVALLSPFEAVADSEALAVLRLAQSQADEIERAEAKEAERKKKIAEAELEDRKEQACRANLKCWADRQRSDARLMCTMAVERSAKYQSEWIDGLLTEPRFTPLSAGSRNGSVLWVGDQVKFQNGFGAWQRMLYVCDYDPSVGKAIDVVVKPRNE